MLHAFAHTREHQSRIACQGMLFTSLGASPCIVPVPVTPSTPSYVTKLSLGHVYSLAWMDKAFATALRAVAEPKLRATTFFSEDGQTMFTLMAEPPTFSWTRKEIWDWDSAILVVKHTDTTLLDLRPTEFDVVADFVDKCVGPLSPPLLAF